MISLVLQIAASVVTAVGVVFAGITLRGSQLQRNRQFEALYIQRYWKLIDELPAEVALGIRTELNAPDRHVVRRYILLCQDEVEMYVRGWITNRTFQEWLPGMRAQLKEGPFADEWKIVREATEDLPESERPFRHLTAALATTAAPSREVNSLRLWLRGM